MVKLILWKLTSSGCVENVKLLLDGGVPIEIKDKDNATPVGLIAIHCPLKFQIHYSVGAGHAENTQYLIRVLVHVLISQNDRGVAMWSPKST